MIIGVPREPHRLEHRVGLTPFAVRRLTQHGHTVLIERQAGDDAHFTDQNYEGAGGRIVYTAEEAFKRADIVCRVGPVGAEEIDLLQPGSIVCSFQHLAVARRETVASLIEKKMTLIGYEVIRDAEGGLPVLHPFSEMAGQMALHIAAQYLRKEWGGRGVLMGNVAGVPPPTVVVLGAGAVGHAAARLAHGTGAHVIVLDADLAKLQSIHRAFGGHVATVVAATERLGQYTAIADVLIGAILIPGGRAPFLVSEEMVRGMKSGSVIIDVSIDQGGCVETSRPTTLDDPIFTAHDVVHYCVPNMTAGIPRTASRALANAAMPYVEALADAGLDEALRADPGLAAGVYMYRGSIVNERVGGALRIETTPLARLLSPSAGPS